jgi:NAD(P)-dependent dehydrogenase (short-subunit alcohol dehydrogenase family)
MSKVIIVTGASSGLGFAIASYLSQKGNIVYGTSRSIQNSGQNFKTLAMDVCNADSVKQAVDSVLKEQGRIDVVINNAGLGIAGAVEHLDLNDVQKVFDTNLFGVVRVCQAVLPAMRKNKQGVIVNISSIGSEMGLPYRGAYSASKAALDRITEAMRMEVKKFGISVCTIQPGGIITDINKNRIMSPLPSTSPYKESFERTYQIINASVSQGLSADDFGPVVENIINSKRIKRSYRVGKSKEKLSVIIKKFFPDFVFEKIITNHYKI